MSVVMTTERWRQIERLFHAALNCDANRRAEFLASACAGDDELLREVNSLLVARDKAKGVMAENAFQAYAREIAADNAESTPSEALRGDSQNATSELSTEQRLPGSFALSPGTMLGERYLIERKIGHGGVGIVFLARDKRLHNAAVVIKLLAEGLLDLENRAWFEKKFRQEVYALARIDHPGVVRALDVGELPDGRAYLVMQYVPGMTLRSVIQPQGQPQGPQGMELRRAADLLRQMGQALTAAHQQGVIHRDLKPENIMLQIAGAEERVRLIDFGIATVLDTAEAGSGRTTQVVGTRDYMSPEQLQGRPSHASDIYALGVIAYEMLTGRRPFNPETAAQLLELQRGGVKIMPCDLRPSLPRAAQAVILKSLSFTPEDRYASAKGFTEDLARALTNAPNTQEEIIERSVVSEIPGAALTISASNLRQDRSRRYKMALTVFAIAALGATALAWQTFFNNEDRRTGPLRQPPQNQVECQLSYSLTVRRNPKIFPNQRSFSLPGEMLFGAGDRVRFQISVTRNGFIYIVNQSPELRDGLPLYNVLFPISINNRGSAAVPAAHSVQIPQPSRNPERDWFKLDKEQGSETVWLIWSDAELPSLEAVKGWANPKHQGAVGDADQRRALSQFLAAQTPSSPERDETGGRTVFKTNSNLLVGRVKIEHR
jgi:serine/threonine protein kinase